MGEITVIDDLPVELIQYMGTDAIILGAARTSTQGDVAEYQREMLSEYDERLIDYLARDHHASPFEHCVMTFRVTAPLSIGRQILRHRVNSYNEESGRYRQMKPTFYIPPRQRPLRQVGKPGAYTFEPGLPEQRSAVVRRLTEVYQESYAIYESLLDAGVAREVARFALPSGLCSTMWITMKLRNAFQFLSLRIHDEDAIAPSFPQWEIERIAEKIEGHIEMLYPRAHQVWVKHGRPKI